jgi:hypothetical protein
MPRYDEVWVAAMALEAAEQESPNIEGSALVFDDDAAASFASASDD